MVDHWRASMRHEARQSRREAPKPLKLEKAEAEVEPDADMEFHRRRRWCRQALRGAAGQRRVRRRTICIVFTLTLRRSHRSGCQQLWTAVRHQTWDDRLTACDLIRPTGGPPWHLPSLSYPRASTPHACAPPPPSSWPPAPASETSPLLRARALSHRVSVEAVWRALARRGTQALEESRRRRPRSSWHRVEQPWTERFKRLRRRMCSTTAPLVLSVPQRVRTSRRTQDD